MQWMVQEKENSKGHAANHSTTTRAAKQSATALVKTDGVENESAPPLFPLPLPVLVPLLPPDVGLFELLESSGSGTPFW